MVNNYRNEKLVQNAKSFRMMYDTVKSLRHSKGFYSRLYDALTYNVKNNREDLLDFLNNSELPKFKDTVDVVMYLEG